MCSLTSKRELTYFLFVMNFVNYINNLFLHGEVLFEIEFVLGWEWIEYCKQLTDPLSVIQKA